MTTYTFNGKTYDDTNLVGTDSRGYNDPLVTGTGVTVPRMIAPMIDSLADLANAHITTSTSSVLIGTGAKTFVLAADIPLVPGETFQAFDTAAPTTNNVFGTITSYTSATNTAIVNVDIIAGSGTKTSWDFVGKLGLRGPIGLTGGGLTNVVDDISPQLGGILDINSQDITGVRGNLQLQMALAAQVFN